jgi:hypothetical protein
MYCLVSEKPLRLVYGTFYLAIGDTFYESFIMNRFQNDQVRSLRLSACPVKSFLYLTGVQYQVEDPGL